ncbi:transcription termination factor NusA, partial [bacterium]|nr:transcription termination factor NusA [bacterium]
TGVVQRFEREGVIIDVGQTEALLPFRELPHNSGLHHGDRIRCLVLEVRQVSKGPQILLSRTHPELVKLLFDQEVPEIADGTVVIESVTREPGDRAKIAVSCKDKNIDPVGACVGMKGSRVQMVVRELRGEKVDIVPWSDDPEVFIANALNPAKITKVKIDEKSRQAVVIVPEGQLSLAIGKHGQNARLASKLTGWNIDIISEDEEKNRTAEKELESVKDRLRELGEKQSVTRAMGALEGIGEKAAERLFASGIHTVEQLAECTVEQLTAIEGIGSKKAHKILESAKTAVEKESKKADQTTAV